MIHSDNPSTLLPRTRRIICACLLGFLSVAVTQRLHAQMAAFNGTLADYLSLDVEGVSIGDSVFSNFQLLERQTGASGFRTDFIDVVPLLDDPSAPGFRFEIMDGATADDFFQLRFSFDVAGASYDNTSLFLSEVNVLSGSNAGTDVLLDLTTTGDLGDNLGNVFAFAGPGDEGDLDESVSFTEAEQLTVEFDAVIDGGGVGRPGEVIASIGSAEVRIGLAPVQPATDLVINAFGPTTADPDIYFIEFTSAPSTDHILRSSEALVDGFGAIVTLTSGNGRTTGDGTARVEFDVSDLGDSHFFRLETSS